MKNIRYVDYLKIYIKAFIPMFLAIIAVDAIMRLFGLTESVYISPGTLIGNIVIPMIVSTFWLWRKQCDLL